MNKIQLFVFYIRLRLATRKAVELNRIDGKRYLVINIQGRPRVIAQKDLRKLIRQHVFVKGTTIEDIRQRALFITK